MHRERRIESRNPRRQQQLAERLHEIAGDGKLTIDVSTDPGGVFRVQINEAAGVDRATWQQIEAEVDAFEDRDDDPVNDPESLSPLERNALITQVLRWWLTEVKGVNRDELSPDVIDPGPALDRLKT